MNRSAKMKFGSAICAIALSCGLLGGCASSAINSATEEQQANRSYMSQVNEVMEELDGGLALFVDAVSRNDVVNMRTQADNAYKALDKLDKLEAPESLADVQEKYTQGTEKLKDALDDYVELYTNLNSGAIDQATANERIAEIQALYDEGIDLLEEGDKAAAGKE